MKKYYKKIFNYFKEKKWQILIYFISSFLIVGTNTIVPALSAKGLEAISKLDLYNMLKCALLIFVVECIHSLISIFNNDASSKIQDDVEIKIKADVSRELFKLEMKNFDKEGTGFFAERINQEPRALASIFQRIRYNFIDIFTSLGIMIYICYINLYLGLYFLIISLIIFIFDIRRTKKWEKERKTYYEMNEKYVSNFGELIRGIKDIKVLNLKNYLIKKTTKNQEELIKYNYEIQKEDRKFYFMENIFYDLKELLLIVVCIILIKNNLLSGANLLIVYMYRNRATGFINSLSSIYRDLKDFNLSIERLYEVIDGNKYPKEKFGNMKIKDIKGNIEFKNVYFKYDDNSVINGVSFKIKPCETIGIVGASGAGKSTIFNLINKLYTVNKGHIYIDGIDINQLDEDTIRNGISTITQNPYIFNTSIKENLLMVNPSASDKEIKEKCNLCLLDEYINTLKDKYETKLGENGVILSGGLKQRLAIARALIKNSKIILLDEATSSLDNESQDYIHSSIKKIRKDYTIIIIAHRLSTVVDCDKILVVDKGKIVGFDTHQNLIKNNAVYKRLYKKELVK